MLPDCPEDCVARDNPAQVVDACVDEWDLAVLGFAGVRPAATGRPGVLETLQRRPDSMPDAMPVRRATAEHAFGTLKAWMGGAPFRTKGLKGVRPERSLAILADTRSG